MHSDAYHVYLRYMLKASDFDKEQWLNTSHSILKDIIEKGFSLSLYPPGRAFLQWFETERSFSWMGTIKVDVQDVEEHGRVYRMVIAGNP